MKKNRKKPPIILALNPSAKYLGIAIFKGNELIYWKIRKLREKGKGPDKVLTKVEEKLLKLMADYEPEIVIVGHPSRLQLKNSPFLRLLLKEIRKLAKRKNHLIIPLIEARKHVCKDMKPTKMNTAKIIATYHCPWLYRRYEKELKKEIEGQWWKKKYHTVLFDAVALGLHCYEKISRRTLSPPPEAKSQP